MTKKKKIQKQVIYLTEYEKKYDTIIRQTTQDYGTNCIICQTPENITITPILPESIYTELAHERWNNIPLCKYCQEKLEDKNAANPNGIRNLIQLIKQEHLKWFNK